MKKQEKVMAAIVSLLFSIWFFSIMIADVPTTYAAVNQTVLSKVNVSNTDPRIYNVTIPSTITLNAGTTTEILCNATIWDYNGVPGDVLNVSGIFYLSTTTPGGIIKNDTKYVANCTNVTSISSTSWLYTCNFTLQYFARNGTWNCSVNVTDKGKLSYQDSNMSTIEPLIALNVTDELDFGIVPALNTSGDALANITNFGNTLINISVRGWGGQNESLYENLSMICEYGNISIDLERYNITGGNAWDGMSNLTGINAMIPGLQVYPRNDTDSMKNITYWKLRVPTGVGGLCNGTVLFTASNANG